MTLSGEQWLDQVFRPAVGVAATEGSRSAGMVAVEPLRVLGGQLMAQVEALGDTGVLTDEQERAALDALASAGIMPEIESRSVSTSRTSGSAVQAPAARGEPPRLLGVLAGPRQVGQLDGRPVTLVSAELWTDRTVVDLYADPGPEFRERRVQATREHLDWLRNQRRGRSAARPDPAPVGAPLGDLTWELHDQRGTRFHSTGDTNETGPYLDRRRMQWSPAVGHFTLRAVDADGTVVLTAEIVISGHGRP